MASEDEKFQAVFKAEMRISKAKDVRKEMELIIKPYANWEEYLMPAPLSVALLGQLIFISAGQGDFSINKNPLPQGFRHQIRLLTATIPDRMKLIVQTLFQEVEVANALLPGQLNSMKSIAVKCSTLAHSVRDKYENVILLIHELLEASRNAKTGYEKELEEVQAALNQAKIREEAAKKNMTLVKEFHDKMKQQKEDSFDQYKKAMDDVPSGWKAIGMKFVEDIGNTVINGLNFFPNTVNLIPNLLRNKFGGSAQGAFCGSDIPNSELFSAKRICNFSSMILTFASGIMENVVKENGLNFEEVCDKKTEQVKINWVKKGFLDLKNDINREENCQPKGKALKIVLDGYKSQAATFDTYSKAALRTFAFTPKSPKMAECQQALTGECVGVRNAHLKVEQSREMYKETQQEYEKSLERFKEQNKELTDILCQMENCRVKEIDFEAALKILAAGLKAMAKVKEQWEKMILFFEMISNIIDARLNQNISDCVEFVSGVQQIKGYSSESFVIDTIYNHVFSASAVAHLVHMIAETYTEVSCNYLMDRVSSLGRLLTQGSTESTPRFSYHSIELLLLRGLKAILNIVEEKKEEFDRDVLARMQTIEREMKAVLPPISVEERKMIEQAVHDGRKELKAWEEDQFV
uniref:Uncharacterized protein n=1 Tax=Sphaerodactylus townsendi TaxID=933632 RepID=A0ACB8EGK1_9SAUR